MSDTHVNAYVREAEAARDDVIHALGAFDYCKQTLESHPDYTPSMAVTLPYEVKPVTPPAPKKVEAKA